MKYFSTTYLLLLLTFYGCKSQEEMIFSSQDVVKENEETSEETNDLMNTLGLSKWEQISNTKTVFVYKIDSVQISSNPNQYGRKLTRLDSMKTENLSLFIEKIQNGKNYTPSESEEFSFNPSYLFELCETKESCETSILMDQSTYKLGFINLDGQKILQSSPSFSDYLSDLVASQK